MLKLRTIASPQATQASSQLDDRPIPQDTAYDTTMIGNKQAVVRNNSFGCEPSAIDLSWMRQGAPLTVLV
jgi:hypothetical protein